MISKEESRDWDVVRGPYAEPTDCVSPTHPTEELRYAANYLSETRDALEDANRNWALAAKRWDAALNEIAKWQHDVAPGDPQAELKRAP